MPWYSTQEAITRTTTHDTTPAAASKCPRSSTAKAARISKVKTITTGVRTTKKDSTASIRPPSKMQRPHGKHSKLHRMKKGKLKDREKTGNKTLHRFFSPTEDEAYQPKGARSSDHTIPVGTHYEKGKHYKTYKNEEKVAKKYKRKEPVRDRSHPDAVQRPSKKFKGSSSKKELTDSYEEESCSEHTGHWKKDTDTAQPATTHKAQGPPVFDEDSSELELLTTFRIKKVVAEEIADVIEQGHSIEYQRTARGLAQISSAEALKALRDLRCAVYTNAQQYLDNYIAVVHATQGITAPYETLQHKKAREARSHHCLWTQRQIIEQLQFWAMRPSSRPAGLNTYEQGMFRIKDIMKYWGTKDGITTKQLLQAIKAHSGKWANRLSLCTLHNQRMLKVHSTPPIGQAEAKDYTTNQH